jgi:chromosome segregation ATPase
VEDQRSQLTDKIASVWQLMKERGDLLDAVTNEKAELKALESSVHEQASALQQALPFLGDASSISETLRNMRAEQQRQTAAQQLLDNEQAEIEAISAQLEMAAAENARLERDFAQLNGLSLW